MIERLRRLPARAIIVYMNFLRKKCGTEVRSSKKNNLMGFIRAPYVITDPCCFDIRTAVYSLLFLAT